MTDLQGRVAVITGGGGHIGSKMGEALAELGADIVILDVDKELTHSTCEKIENLYGVATLPLVKDLTDLSALGEIPQLILKDFGGIHILINNAAVGGKHNLTGWVTSFESQSIESWEVALRVNLTAAFELTKVCSQALKGSGQGSVVNVSSIYGMVGPDWSLYKDTDLGNPAAYAVSKGGLIQLTKWLATTLAPNVRVNAISPGGVFRDHDDVFKTRYESKTPLKRMASEDDFKGVAVFLASDLSRYVTGQNIAVDGGWTVW